MKLFKRARGQFRSKAAFFTEESTQTSPKSARRIVDAYLRAVDHGKPEPGTMWDAISSYTAPFHDALLSGDHARLRVFLDHPEQTEIFYGFENIWAPFLKQKKAAPVEELEAFADQLGTSLERLAEAVGAIPLYFPEAGQPRPKRPIEDVLDALCNTMGFDLDFANPFVGEVGLTTSRGLVSHRSVGAIYQAWRIKQLVERYGSRVVEIGAGLGRTAYYAYRLGVTDYTIIDLPITGASQANFLCRTLGDKAVRLFGEPPGDQAVVNILPPAVLSDLHFDVVANVDSLTEMGAKAATDYFAQIKRAKVFWSVNHEFNDVTIADLGRSSGAQVSRCPYWLRDGYVEELFLF